MRLAIVENEQILTLGDSSELFPNISFPPTGPNSEFLLENSAMEVVSWEMFDGSSEKQITVEPYIKEGKVYTCITLPKTLEELAAEERLQLESLTLSVRNQRNQLLKDSDWTQVADAPVDKQVWAEYRQQLRDITLQSNFPTNVVFPQLPN